VVDLDIESCDGGCSSRVDNEIVISLPQVEIPRARGIHHAPAHAGVMENGFVGPGPHHCLNPSLLRIRFQSAGLGVPSASPEMTPNVVPAASGTGCDLTGLDVVEISVPDRSVLTVAVIAPHIFPGIESHRWNR